MLRLLCLELESIKVIRKKSGQSGLGIAGWESEQTGDVVLSAIIYLPGVEARTSYDSHESWSKHQVTCIDDEVGQGDVIQSPAN